MTELGLLGPKYTYHDLARKQFFPNEDHKFYTSFGEIFTALKKGQIKQALIAISNNTSGKVSNNLEKIRSEGFKIINEFDLPIHLCLGSKFPLTIEKIKKIYSHPMAIKETQRFFAKYSHITFVASTSTSGAIEELNGNRQRNAAVISSKEAIESNQLVLVSENIEDDPKNTTTFALIEA